MKQFLTLEGAWDEFLLQSGLEEKAGHDPAVISGAKDLFMAGCQGVLMAFANIKEHTDSDGHAAIPFIMHLYAESDEYAKRCEEDNQKAEEMTKAWPFPTGTRN